MMRETMAGRDMMITLGSLFDGSGGFPLAGALNGIITKWLAEIEPYPCRVTAARFPEVPNHGDVCGIRGDRIQPVDIVTFGSPCQDLSVAGGQAGIHKGERSSLFFEAIRIIKEMRNGTANQFPRFAVWENVPGAFSSNKGEDFRAVLQALCEITKIGGVSVPRPQGGRWLPAGCVVGDGFSVAWRQYDAQYWGVPQRRKRIYLIADFAGERAGEILFVEPGVSWNPEPGRETGKGTSGNAERSAGRSDRSVFSLQGNAVDRNAGMNGCGWCENVAHSLNTQDRHAVAYPEKARSLCARGDSSPCLDRGQNVVVYDARGNGGRMTAPTITGDHERRVSDYTALCVGNGQLNQMSMQPVCNTLDTMHDKQAILTEGEPPRKYIVRRLTPLECCRLQGFPDWWCDGVEGSDTAQYKMWGNGIALPCAVDVLGRIANAIRNNEKECMERKIADEHSASAV